MVCKGCGERMFGPTRDYCKACRIAMAAAPLPSGPQEDPMPDDKQAVPTPDPPASMKPVVLPPLPEGFRYLYNRRDKRFEGQFDGRIYELQPYETKPFVCYIAEHLRAHSIIPGTLRRDEHGGMVAERWLACGPGWTIIAHNKTEASDQFGNNTYVPEYGEATPDKDFGVPTETKPGRELFDRTSIPNYVERGSQDGRPTHVEYVKV